MSALAVVSRPAGQDAEDLDLVAAVRAGDDRAFEALYRRYHGRITGYVRGMVHDHGRAEDITQEIFMSALRRMRASDAAIAFKPWIYEIAKNACIDAWRRTRNANEVSFDAQDALGADDHGRLADPGVTPDSAIDNKDALDNLCGAFGSLSPTHHEILVMREFEGLSYREIGERLGMSRPGVESTLFRARKRLSEEYEELVSGERCVRVQRIVDSSGGQVAGVRDQRRMARHLSHCQPCRRYARLAGVDLGTPVRPAAAAAAKIAAWFPLPLFMRRRWGGGEELVGHAHHGPLAQWSSSLAGSVDPALVSGWSKAAATAATVAVAGLGAGAAIHEHRAIERFVGGDAPAAPLHTRLHSPAGAKGAPQRAHAHRAGGASAGSPRVSGTPAKASLAGDPVSRNVAGASSPPLTKHGPLPGDFSSATLPGAPKTGSRAPVGAGSGSAQPVGIPDPAGAAPTGQVAAGPQSTSLGRVVDDLGLSPAAGGSAPTAPTGSDAPAASAPESEPVVGGAVSQAGGVVGALSAPTPGTPASAAPAKPASATSAKAAALVAGNIPPTVTALAATVSATVTSTLAAAKGRPSS
jgi:RNA polymerase sigma factor (sigma-70 family)